MTHSSPLPPRRRLGAAALAAAAVLALGGAGSAQAKPVITGFSVTPERGHAACGGREDCLRFTFRAFDASRARNSKLRFRLIVTRTVDGARKLNVLGTFPNSEAVQRYWVWPKRPFSKGAYTARVIVTGAAITKSPVRTFRWGG